jgi:hypothetical protein
MRATTITAAMATMATRGRGDDHGQDHSDLLPDSEEYLRGLLDDYDLKEEVANG